MTLIFSALVVTSGKIIVSDFSRAQLDAMDGSAEDEFDEEAHRKSTTRTTARSPAQVKNMLKVVCV